MKPSKKMKNKALKISSASNISHNSVVDSMSSSDKPTYGTVMSVRMSQMNSLKHFFVHSVIDSNYIKTTMCSALEVVSNNSKSKIPPKAGDFIAARYVDGLWYRAKVTKNNKSGLYGYFIDFGDKEEIVTEFKNLSKDLIDMKPPMAYRCHFKNLSKGAEVELNDSNLYILQQFFSANKMTATFFSTKESYGVTLSLKNGKDVLDLINELIWEGIIPLINDPVHIAKQRMLNEILCLGCDQRKEVVVRIGPFKSTENFYIETKSSNTVARKIRSEIDNMQNCIFVLQPKVGQILIAKCQKFKKLYRVRLVWQYPDSEVFKCYLIDCGIFEDCSIFFKPNKYLRTAPPVKIHCSLKAPKQYTTSLLQYINHCFIDELNLCRNDRKILELIKISNPCIIDLSIKGLNLSEIIMPCQVKVIDINKAFQRFRAFTARLICPEFLKITDTLKYTKTFKTVENPQLMQLYVAKDNERYKRVKLMDITPTGSFNVFIVDELRKMLHVDVLYKLPKSIVDAKTTNLYCNLALASDDLKNSCCEKKFIDICNCGETTFSMVVVKNDFVSGHLVRLLLKSIDVSTMIAI